VNKNSLKELQVAITKKDKGGLYEKVAKLKGRKLDGDFKKHDVGNYG